VRFEMTPASILLIVAIALFILAAFGVGLGPISLVPLGLAAFAASFLFAGRGILG
jgi:hypothetical protein